MNCNYNTNSINLKNIIIIDWDDTLFPTTWLNQNKINLENIESIEEYILYFNEIDRLISDLLYSYNRLGHLYIVSNASIDWIKLCLNRLPKTKYVIVESNIRIVSARDVYSKLNIPSNQWKIHSFKDIIKNILINNIIDDKLLNIISIGDASYEYDALINLDNYFKNNKIEVNYLLKSVKFIEKPHVDIVIEQLNMIKQNTSYIINKIGYVDLKFT